MQEHDVGTRLTTHLSGCGGFCSLGGSQVEGNISSPVATSWPPGEALPSRPDAKSLGMSKSMLP